MQGSGNAAKRWVFTLNNPGDDEAALVERLQRSREAGATVYAVVGRETGASGTPHLQGYVELSTRKRFNFVKELVSSRAHIEISRGSREQASSYCKKDGDYVEIGEPIVSQQGKRTDLERVKAILDEGGDILDVAHESFGTFLRYEKSLVRYQSMVQRKRDWVPDVYVFWGTTGTGKTRKVHEDESDLWVACDNSLKWFDGYTGQPAVLFDDFISVKNERFGFLLQLLDRYAMSVPVKGGFVNWCPRRIYFTSNLPIEEWYTGVSVSSAAALRRRITKQVHFSNGLVGWSAQRSESSEEAD